MKAKAEETFIPLMRSKGVLMLLKAAKAEIIPGVS
jgi:hypothetical protein